MCSSDLRVLDVEVPVPRTRDDQPGAAHREGLRAGRGRVAVLKVNRLHKEARVRLGLCHYHLEEYVQAKDTLLMALRQHPQDYLARLYLGLSYARRRQVEKCMDVWKDFMNREHIGVMREINAHKALHECGEALDGIEMADAVEKALAAVDRKSVV